MNIISMKLSDLKPLEKNVRRHYDNQIKEMIRSVKQFGQTRAIVIDEENNILIGNGLYLALKEMGVEDVDCFRKDGLSEKEKKKLILTDNKVYSLGLDNYETINEFVNEIAMDGDFDIAGFDEEVIRQMTRDLEGVENDVMEYGKVDPKPTPARKEIEVIPVQNIHSEAVTDKSDEQIPTEKHFDAPQEEQEQPRKSIICPCCGEVIYLD